jgi:transcriptional regulator with XRE-family HTH domain
MADSQKVEHLSTPERIRALRLKSGRSESDMATELGMTAAGYEGLELHDGELESGVSIAQAVKLAGLLQADLLALMGEIENPVKMPIARVRAALNTQLGHSAEAREGLEDLLDWDLGPFLEGSDQWTHVYTIEFVRRLATAIEIDWQVLLAGIAHPHT